MANVLPADDKQYGSRGLLGMSAFGSYEGPKITNFFLDFLADNYAQNQKFTFLPKPGNQGATLTVGGDYQVNGGGIVNLANIINLPYSGPPQFSVRKFSSPL